MIGCLGQAGSWLPAGHFSPTHHREKGRDLHGTGRESCKRTLLPRAQAAWETALLYTVVLCIEAAAVFTVGVLQRDRGDCLQREEHLLHVLHCCSRVFWTYPAFWCFRYPKWHVFQLPLPAIAEESWLVREDPFDGHRGTTQDQNQSHQWWEAFNHYLVYLTGHSILRAPSLAGSLHTLTVFLLQEPIVLLCCVGLLFICITSRYHSLTST